MGHRNAARDFRPPSTPLRPNLQAPRRQLVLFRRRRQAFGVRRFIAAFSKRPPSRSPNAQRLAANKAAHQGGGILSHKDWPHAPIHRLDEHGTYFNTAGTLHKEHWFRGPERLDLLETALLRIMKEAGWRLEAWAVFSNHYHFVAHSEPGSQNLRAVLKRLHGETSRDVNLLDGTLGRTVWHNFWEVRLTFERSYLARLNYVHQNAVKHGLVPIANQYRWCSATARADSAPAGSHDLRFQDRQAERCR